MSRDAFPAVGCLLTFSGPPFLTFWLGNFELDFLLWAGAALPCFVCFCRFLPFFAVLCRFNCRFSPFGWFAVAGIAAEVRRAPSLFTAGGVVNQTMQEVSAIAVQLVNSSWCHGDDSTLTVTNMDIQEDMEAGELDPRKVCIACMMAHAKCGIDACWLLPFWDIARLRVDLRLFR